MLLIHPLPPIIPCAGQGWCHWMTCQVRGLTMGSVQAATVCGRAACPCWRATWSSVTAAYIFMSWRGLTGGKLLQGAPRWFFGGLMTVYHLVQ
ncbi:hypothetical protein CHLRE_06g298911v5 [Chlamydomonas reinhardtii]|uniref:Uncharacterized protein n=1 Tax=Chlamydomonas reinhardtii TaxID=3055 RepID=A0A2K3DQT9_CHLRE|nr:uncharacterized protein CHLRE_06g298911v5 [Chlamydomonas reinhardtii]PNW82904.1 hypothetical protein CHLRE_06g298911v5 [Chlamydomonas reinhardtii]